MLDYSITQSLEMAKRCNGKSVATVSYSGKENTYQELYERVVCGASGLMGACDLKRGDVAGILALNSFKYLEYFFLCPWAGR